MDCKSLKKLITQNKRELKKAQKALDKAMKDYEKCKKKDDAKAAKKKAAKKKAKKATVAQKKTGRKARMNTKRKPKFIAITPTPKATGDENQKIPLPLNSEIDKLIKNKFIPGDIIYVGGIDFNFDYDGERGPWRFIEILKYPVKGRNWRKRDFSFNYVVDYSRNDAIEELTDASAIKIVQKEAPEVVYPMSKSVADGLLNWMTQKGKEYSFM